jgi:sigma-B regulation protein RsbU (phosphoserine phosphatase)
MGGAGRVLIAEDDAPMRSLLAAALGRKGYEVATAADGREALNTSADGDFDCVLLDRVMPAADGLETLRCLRMRFDPAALPVIMLTAVDDSRAVVDALDAGANDYVTKPFDLSVVLARVRTQVTLHRQATALQQAEKRLRSELEAAARVQQASLPPRDPRFGPYRFAWRYEPCEQLSGDGLNIVPVTARHVAFYVFDVTGHGVRSALLSAAVGRLLLPVSGEAGVINEPGSRNGRSVSGFLNPAAVAIRPAEVAARLARRFREHPVEGLFFTLFYGLLDVTTGDVTYASAGHPAPIGHAAGNPPRPLPLGGMMIGIDADSIYENHVVRLAPGDRLIVHTDGVTEARAPSGELFGSNRLLRVLAESPPDLSATLDVVADACGAWSGGTLSDDRTLLAIERAEA